MSTIASSRIRGIVEEVTQTQSDAAKIGRLHYLPHLAVVRRDKETTKVRVVYDAPAKSTGFPLMSVCTGGRNLTRKYRTSSFVSEHIPSS